MNLGSASVPLAPPPVFALETQPGRLRYHAPKKLCGRFFAGESQFNSRARRRVGSLIKARCSRRSFRR